MTTPPPYAPNLYDSHGLDCDDDCDALGLLISSKDARLEQMGYGEHDVRRQELSLVYAIMSDTACRKAYDDAIAAGNHPTWPELEHLSNFGSWPDPSLSVRPNPAPGMPAPGNPFAQTQQAQQPGINPFAQAANQAANPMGPQQYNLPVHQHPSAMQQHAMQGGSPHQATGRATLGTRIGLAIADSFLATMFATIMMGIVGGVFDSDMGALIISAVAAVAYYVGAEVMWGGTPMKKIAGYEVRDVDTGERLSFTQSAKRNWFRLVNLVPGLGSLVCFIASIVLMTTISSANQLRGAHDRLANAEVVKKQQ